MKQLTKLSYLLITFLIVFSCDNQTDDTSVNPSLNSEYNRSIEEITTLIQTDPLTALHNTRMNNQFIAVEQLNDASRSSEATEAMGSTEPELPVQIEWVSKEETMAYYNSMLKAYPELKELTIEEQIEVIYNIKLSEVDKVAQDAVDAYEKGMANDSRALSAESGPDYPCQPLVQAAITLMQVSILLYDLGLSDLAQSIDPIVDMVVGMADLCNSLTD